LVAHPVSGRFASWENVAKIDLSAAFTRAAAGASTGGAIVKKSSVPAGAFVPLPPEHRFFPRM